VSEQASIWYHKHKYREHCLVHVSEGKKQKAARSSEKQRESAVSSRESPLCPLPHALSLYLQVLSRRRSGVRWSCRPGGLESRAAPLNAWLMAKGLGPGRAVDCVEPPPSIWWRGVTYISPGGPWTTAGPPCSYALGAWRKMGKRRECQCLPGHARTQTHMRPNGAPDPRLGPKDGTCAREWQGVARNPTRRCRALRAGSSVGPFGRHRSDAFYPPRDAVRNGRFGLSREEPGERELPLASPGIRDTDHQSNHNFSTLL
jgi:hypothetical protein